jgi:hypothetical protein
VEIVTQTPSRAADAPSKIIGKGLRRGPKPPMALGR